MYWFNSWHNYTRWGWDWIWSDCRSNNRWWIWRSKGIYIGWMVRNIIIIIIYRWMHWIYWDHILVIIVWNIWNIWIIWIVGIYVLIHKIWYILRREPRKKLICHPLFDCLPLILAQFSFARILLCSISLRRCLSNIFLFCSSSSIRLTCFETFFQAHLSIVLFVAEEAERKRGWNSREYAKEDIKKIEVRRTIARGKHFFLVTFFWFITATFRAHSLHFNGLLFNDRQIIHWSTGLA